MSDVIEIPEPEGGERIGLTIEQVIPDEANRGELVAYLRQEIEQVQSDRGDIEEKWEMWKRQRLAKPEQETKSYPWPNASNVTVPLAASITNNLFATTKHKFSLKKPLFAVEALNRDYADHSEVLEEFVNLLMEGKHQINLRKKHLTLFYDIISLGTQFIKVPWKIDQWRFRRDGTEVEKTVYDGPDVIPIPIEDFFCKLHIDDLQRAPWIATRIRLQEHELREKQALGIYENVELILDGFAEKVVEDYQQEALDNQDLNSTLTDAAPEYEIYEGFVRWDTDDDGLMEDIKFWFHLESGVILRLEFNEMGVRDIVRIPYMQVPYSLYGLGVGHMCEQLQEEADTLHNTRINSQHLHSLNGFVTRTGNAQLDHMKLKPLFNIKTDAPKEDFVQIKFPDVSASTFSSESIVWNLAEKITGSNNALMGQPDDQAKTRATASGTMFLAQQGGKLYEAISTNIEEGIGELGLFVVYQLVANSDRVKEHLANILDPEKQALLNDVLDLNVEDIPASFNFSVRVTPSDQTEDAKLQKAMTMMQLHDLYADRTLALAERIFMLSQQAPDLVESATKLYVARSKIMEETLELLGVADPTDFTVYIKDLELMLQQQEMMKDQQIGGMRNAIGGNGSQMGAGYGQGGAISGPAPNSGNPSPNGPDNGQVIE